MNTALTPNTLNLTCPNVVIDQIEMANKTFYVVRDDLLTGGTKQRGLMGLLSDLQRKGHRRFVYASPFCGYAQIALSVLSQMMNLECVLFCGRDPSSHRAHPYTLRAQSHGARVFLFDTLGKAQAAASQFCDFDPSFHEIPLGFDCPQFYRHYQAALSEQWQSIELQLRGAPKNLWLPVGSGTLARSFLHVLKGSPTRIQAVDVHVLDSSDSRIGHLSQHPQVELWSAPWRFQQPEQVRPLFPSNAYYDAKIGPILERHGTSGDLWWNVAA